jgi:DMSO/TMAO reductase YedYZ molybdopterin-dependent catalytic subunit
MNADDLPPGQYELGEFPRFGLLQFATRFPKEMRVQLAVAGEVLQPVVISDELGALPRVDRTSDFHCVTTWTRRGVRWSGFRFADFYEQIVVPRAGPRPDASWVVLKCQDGYATSLPLSDLLADTVLLADTLDGAPLTIEHGAPLRLVAPAHYGYKSAKHLCAVDFSYRELKHRSAPFRFMSHPRGRVALEERGTGVPGWILRYLYRPLVRPAIHRFRRATERHRALAAQSERR